MPQKQSDQTKHAHICFFYDATASVQLRCGKIPTNHRSDTFYLIQVYALARMKTEDGGLKSKVQLRTDTVWEFSLLSDVAAVFRSGKHRHSQSRSEIHKPLTSGRMDGAQPLSHWSVIAWGITWWHAVHQAEATADRGKRLNCRWTH